jgi:uncharacterized membrane protein YozB (DUF420 family)
VTEFGFLPTLNALLNGAAGVCLVLGYYFIRKRNVEAHKKAMLTAFAISTVFLVSYLIHHARVGSVRYQGTGFLRTLYFAILIPHVLLAAAVVPLAIVTIRRALRGQFERHRPIARVTLPVWLFVSVTGVAVYVMLYG